MSEESDKDAGVLAVLIERFEKQRLPWILGMKERVDAGEKLTDVDLMQLKEVFDDAGTVKKYIDKYPQLQDATAQAMSLYSEIMDKALENEKSS